MMDTHDAAAVRNLERIQESSTSSATGFGRVATFALVVASGVCVAFCASALGSKRGAAGLEKKGDPLAELALHTSGASSGLVAGEVTFPGILSDRASPATALAAPAGSILADSFVAPPPAGDRLPVVPLPARHALTTSLALSKPKDRLTVLADDATDAVAAKAAGVGGDLASAGSEGGWQLQVSSFKTQGEADTFVTQLRARGHKAHVQVADIPKRGTWYRVKIGPFSTQAEATKYRSAFEAKEKIPGFVVKSGVDPH
ncbi:MAG: SPOR domain-containing protein [Polyangiales bacterium]